MSHKPEYLISALTVKQSQNKLLPTSKDPAFLTLGTKKHGELIEMSIDRFSLLTKQPKRVDTVNLYNYMTIESDLKKRGLYYQPAAPRSQQRLQPVSFKWTSEHMPLIKVRKVDALANREVLTWKESLCIQQTNPVKQAPVKPPIRCLRFK